MRLPVLDLCAGAGGMSMGFHRVDCDVHGVEHDADACETHRRMVGPCSHVDMREYVARPGHWAMVIGGVPCQPHSEQGKKEGLDSEMGRLHEHMARIAREARAEAIVMENVPGLTHARRGRPAAIGSVVNTFRLAGFVTSWRIIDAASFGVAQFRPRVFVVGFRSELAARRFFWPEPTHGKAGSGLQPHVTVRRALKLGCGRFLTKGKHLDVSWWQGCRRIDVDRPSYAIGTRNNADWICPVGEQAYRPRLSQLAVLQGFPEGFVFSGNETAKHTQMGNACPPELARAVGASVREALQTTRAKEA